MNTQTMSKTWERYARLSQRLLASPRYLRENGHERANMEAQVWNYSQRAPITIKVGEYGHKFICHSEAAMHLRVAGREIDFLVVPGAWGAAVQLLNADGTEYSFPILTGEAGLFRNEDGTYYYYPNDHGGS